MKNVLDLLKGTTQIDLARDVVKSGLRELEPGELARVGGGLPMAGASIITTYSNSGGGADDCLDGGPMDCI